METFLYVFIPTKVKFTDSDKLLNYHIQHTQLTDVSTCTCTPSVSERYFGLFLRTSWRKSHYLKFYVTIWYFTIMQRKKN